MNQSQQLLLSIKASVSLSKFTGKILESNNFFQDLVTIIQKLCEVDYCLLLLFEEEIKLYSTIEAKEKEQILAQFSQSIHQEYKNYLEQYKVYNLVIENTSLPLKLKKIVHSLQIQTINLIPLQFHQLQLGIICLYSKRNDIKWSNQKLVIIHSLVAQSIKFITQKQILLKQKTYQEIIKDINYQLNSSHLSKSTLGNILQQVAFTFKVEQVLILKIADCQTLCLKQPQVYSNVLSTNQPQNLKLWQIYQISANSSQTDLVHSDLDALCLQNLSSTQQINFFLETSKIIEQDYLSFKYSLLSLPILIKEEFFGVLILPIKQYERQFSQEELEVLKQISEQIGLAIYLISIQEQLSEKKENEQQTNEYFSNMTHELRAPLAGILGFARMLQEQIYGSLNPKQSQYVNAVVSSGEHLMAIVNDLLDISKIEANREELFLEKLAVEDLCLASLSMVQGKAEQQGLVINLDIAQDIDFCFADQQRFKQILINLLSNAIKFTEQGSVTLKVSRQTNHITFSIIDTGIGITLADQKKLFQPFQQVKSSLSRQHKGTGLGLALSQKLAQLHGGNITIISEVGQGSCFTIELPHQGESSLNLL